MADSFSLVTDPWIKVESSSRLSLQDFFSAEEPPVLGGTPAERFLAFRLLLAITQAAAAPQDSSDLEELTADELKAKVLEYLADHVTCFDLYDPEHPFLQYPQVVSEDKFIPTGDLCFGVCTGNATLLFDGNKTKPLEAADEVYLLLQVLILGLSGKKPDAKIVLAPGLSKKASSPASPSLGRGWLHSMPIGENIFETLRLNLISEEELGEDLFGYLSNGLGVAPWEKKPESEIGPEAEAYAASLFGRLIPLSRFCHIVNGQMHMTSGIAYPTIEHGASDPSVSVRLVDKGKKFSAVYADTSRRPWRQVNALFGFADSQEGCRILKLRAADDGFCGVWCFGIKISEQAGEQYFSGADGYVEEFYRLDENLEESGFNNRYLHSLKEVDQISKTLYVCVSKYYNEMKAADIGKKMAISAQQSFWSACDPYGSAFVKACSDGTVSQFVSSFAKFAEEAYENVCPKARSRQLMAYIKCRPVLWKWMNLEK